MKSPFKKSSLSSLSLLPSLFSVFGVSRKKQKAGDEKEELKKKLKQEFLKQASKLERRLTDLNLEVKAKEFFRFVHHALKELFFVKYECTYEELRDEISSRKMNIKLKHELLEFLDELSHLEYDFKGFVSKARKKRALEKQTTLHYLKALEAEGKKIEPKLKKELNKLLKQDYSSSLKILKWYITRFKKIINQL